MRRATADVTPPDRLRRGALLAALGAALLTIAAGPLAAQTAAPAAAVAPPELAADLAGARLQGSGRARFMGLRVYDIRLWTRDRLADGADWAAAPLALDIEYARTLAGEKIAERSLDEMRRQGEIADADAARWLTAMKKFFPDVREGDRLTGVQLPGQGARFFFNGSPRGELRDAIFAKRFFGIWLSPQTSEPALREALLGSATR